VHSFFAINRLSAYIDGELPDHEAAAVEQAIAEDPSVRDEYTRMLSAVELLRNHGPVEAPPHLHAAILAKVADEPDPVGGFWARLLAPFRLVPMEAVGVVFAVVAVVVLINKQPGLDAPLDPAPRLPVVADEAPKSPEAAPDAATAGEAPRPPQVLVHEGQPAPPAPEAGLPPKPLGKSRGAALPDDPPPSKEKAAPEGRYEPQDKKSSASSASRKSQVPEEPYVPAWDQEPVQQQSQAPGSDDPNVLYSPAPVYYKLAPRDAHGLKELQKLAARYGGTLKTLDGRAFVPRTLSVDDDLDEIRADIPVQNLEAFLQALLQLGHVTPIESPERPLYGGGIVQVRIQVLYEP